MTVPPTAAKRSACNYNWRRRWRLVLICVLCVWGLSSCKHGTMRIVGVPAEVLALTQPLDPVPGEYRKPCPDSLPLASSDDVPTLFRNHVNEVTPVYRACRDNNNALVKAVAAREKKEAERIQRAAAALDRMKDGE
jgi:hypothetical protein